jgi:hypothetical protein
MKLLFATVLALGAANASAIPLFGLTSAGHLARFDSANPASGYVYRIEGLATGDRLIGIDSRPSTGQIYGISLSNRIYTIGESTGIASFVAALSSPIINSTLSYGIDFNPVADASSAASLRLVSSAGDNYAINATTGAVTVAQNIGSGFANIAYSAASAGATSLYYINSATDSLHVATSAFNTPSISLVAPLGIDVLRVGGFDIGSGMAFAALNSDDGSSLATGIYAVNLSTGALTLQASYNGTLSSLTVSAVPEPGTYAMLLAGLAAVGGIARRRRVRS